MTGAIEKRKTRSLSCFIIYVSIFNSLFPLVPERRVFGELSEGEMMETVGREDSRLSLKTGDEVAPGI